MADDTTVPGTEADVPPEWGGAEYASALAGMDRIIAQIKDIRSAMAADQAAIDSLRTETDARLVRLVRLLDANVPAVE